MSLPIVHRREARDDADDAFAWYERQRVGLGDEFLIELRNALNLVEVNPLAYAVVYRDIRASRIHRFPYVVYYRVEPARVVVVAVQHGSRNARHWQSRV